MRGRRWLAVLIGIAGVLAVAGLAKWRSIAQGANMPHAEPFRIAGNLYYVGTVDDTSFLLTGPEGHVLIDGGYPLSAPRIIESIAALGFDIADVKVLLNSHAHFGHAGGLAALQRASSAELWVSEADADVIAAGGAGDPTQWAPFEVLRVLRILSYPAPRVDHRFADGTTVRVGPLELTAHVTAGHTPGCTTWSFPVHDGDRDLLAVDLCSLTVLPYVSLVEPETYPGIQDDFEQSFRALRSLPADIFLASHSSWFDREAKRRAQADAEDPAAPFIDPGGYRDFIDRAEARFRDVLTEQQPPGGAGGGSGG